MERTTTGTAAAAGPPQSRSSDGDDDHDKRMTLHQGMVMFRVEKGLDPPVSAEQAKRIARMVKPLPDLEMRLSCLGF